MQKPAVRNKRWWREVDRRWKKIPHDEGSKRFFWTRKCGLFWLDLEELSKGRWKVRIGGLDGSLSQQYEERFEGNASEAKSFAMKQAGAALYETADSIDGLL